MAGQSLGKRRSAQIGETPAPVLSVHSPWREERESCFPGDQLRDWGPRMGMILAAAAVLGAILCAVFSKVLADEFKAWRPWIAEWLVERAVAKLPEDKRERYGEEWRSHINEVPGDIGKIVVAFGLGSASRAIALAFGEGTQHRSIGFQRRAFDIGFSVRLLHRGRTVVCRTGTLDKNDNRRSSFSTAAEARTSRAPDNGAQISSF